MAAYIRSPQLPADVQKQTGPQRARPRDPREGALPAKRPEQRPHVQTDARPRPWTVRCCVHVFASMAAVRAAKTPGTAHGCARPVPETADSAACALVLRRRSPGRRTALPALRDLVQGARVLASIGGRARIDPPVGGRACATAGATRSWTQKSPPWPGSVCQGGAAAVRSNEAQSPRSSRPAACATPNRAARRRLSQATASRQARGSSAAQSPGARNAGRSRKGGRTREFLPGAVWICMCTRIATQAAADLPHPHGFPVFLPGVSWHTRVPPKRT